MIPKTGERSLSTPLFAEISEEMDAEETAIAESTPGHRFDRTAPAPLQASAPATEAPSPAAAAFVEEAINDPEAPVVMFALEWCEFCWSIRRLFGDLGIPCRSIDLDSVALRKGGFGGEVRAALRARLGSARLGSPTIPQVFVGGRHGVRIADDRPVVARAYLPKWLHAARVRPAGDRGAQSEAPASPSQASKRRRRSSAVRAYHA